MIDKNTMSKYNKTISSFEVGVESLKIYMNEFKTKFTSVDESITLLAKSNKELCQDFKELRDFLKKDPLVKL